MLKVGIVGLGRGTSFINVFSRHPMCQIAAVCDAKPGLADRVARERNIPAAYEDFDRFIDHDLDIVVVATPPAHHVKQSIAALERGRHVLSEVPAVASLEECPVLVEAVKKSSGKYMMGANPDFGLSSNRGGPWCAKAESARSSMRKPSICTIFRNLEERLTASRRGAPIWHLSITALTAWGPFSACQEIGA